MSLNIKLFRVYTVKGDEVVRVGPYTYDERTARALAKTYQSGTGSRGREVKLVPVGGKNQDKENWKDAVTL